MSERKEIEVREIVKDYEERQRTINRLYESFYASVGMDAETTSELNEVIERLTKINSKALCNMFK